MAAPPFIARLFSVVFTCFLFLIMPLADFEVCFTQISSRDVHDMQNRGTVYNGVGRVLH